MTAAVSFRRLAPALCALALLATARPAAASEPLPRFTGEREAAALHFVRKHCPELVPMLEELKKGNRAAYEQQICETFQVTEFLADLQDDPKRYGLELKVWKAENKALVLVARLATPRGRDQKAVEDELRMLAKELAELEVQSLEHQVEILDRERSSAREELGKAREDIDRTAREKFEALKAKAQKKRPVP